MKQDLDTRLENLIEKKIRELSRQTEPQKL